MMKDTNKYSLDRKETKSFLTSLQTKKIDKCFVAVFKLAILTGARISEILSLTRDDVNLDSRKATITLTNTKNKDVRILFLPRRMASYLLKRHCCKNQKKKKSERLFPHPRGSFNVVWRRLSKEKLGKNISPHTLRRTFALKLIEAGYPLNQLQHILGHKSLSTTSVYVRVRAQTNPLDFLLQDDDDL